MLDRISYTRLVVGVVIEPKRDEQGRAERVLGAMTNGLQALVFHRDCLFDQNAKLMLAPNGRFDAEADVLGPVAEMIKDRVQVKLPEREPYRPTPAQEARYKRVLEELARRRVPTLRGALFVDDDDAVTLREPAEVARRALVLLAVTILADGGPREEVLKIIEDRDLWPHVSPKERAFLEAEPTDPDQARRFLWHLERLWVLAWALGEVELGWPTGFCDVPRLTRLLSEHATDPNYVANARLRPKAEILDAEQLTMLIHWAIRDAYIHKRPAPANLDWSSDAPMVPVTQSAAVGVVAERHHALNWLVRFMDADWDDVDTPT